MACGMVYYMVDRVVHGMVGALIYEAVDGMAYNVVPGFEVSIVYAVVCFCRISSIVLYMVWYVA